MNTSVEEQQNAARPAHPNFGAHALKYAAKLAADTVLRDNFVGVPDLSDETLLQHFARCVRPARRAELGMVREAFLAEYHDQIAAARTTPQQIGR